MLELTEREWGALQAADERNYILIIRDEIAKDRPDVAHDPQLLERLNAAYAEAKRIGFTDDRGIVKFLYLESVAPYFYSNPGIATWLGKKGIPPEQRFDMMMDVARAKSRAQKERS